MRKTTSKKNGVFKHIGANHYEVKSFEQFGIVYRADLNEETCSCPAFERHPNTPCKHLIFIAENVGHLLIKHKDELEKSLTFSIAECQANLQAINKSDKLTIAKMKKLLEVEEKEKNRAGITEWLKLGIKMGELPSEYFLDYQGKVSCYKSALQKYIRRSNVEKALRAGKVLWLLGKNSAIRRLKIIIPEDAYSCVALLKYFDDEMTIETYLGIIKTVAEATKDKSCCPLASRISNDPTYKDYVPEITWAQKIKKIETKEQLERLTKTIVKMCDQNRYKEVFEILGESKVVKNCIDRVEAGTFFKSDSVILVITAIRYWQGDYDKDVKVAEIDPKEVKCLGLSEIDWYCLDFHSPIGRIALRWFLAKHRDIDEKELKTAWFMGESVLLEGKVANCEEYFMKKWNKTLWERYRSEIKGIIDTLRTQKFNLEAIDKAYAEK